MNRSHAPAAEARSADRFLDRRPVALALLVSAQFLVMLDTSIVNVALPSIQTDLGVGQSTLQWAVSYTHLTLPTNREV